MDMDMDWYAWLTSAGLEPTVAYEYGLLFSHNELDQEDIPHFDHDFLLSLGVSVGKHRLLILKLASKERRRRRPRPVAGLLAAAGRTRSCLARCLRLLAAGGGGGGARDPSALIAAQRDLFGGGGQWRSAVLKRERKLALLKQGRLMLTDGGVRVTPGPPPSASSSRSPSASPMFCGRDNKLYGGGGGEEMRWDSMFQDLKPT